MNTQISVITLQEIELIHFTIFNSLKNQTYKKFEWIVCDDSSNDKTLKILKNYKRANFKIRIFSFKQRQVNQK